MESFKKVLALSYPIALAASLVFATGYYWHFEIDITSYLGIDDLTLVFLNKVLLIFYFLIVGCTWILHLTTKNTSPSPIMLIKTKVKLTIGEIIAILIPVALILIYLYLPMLFKVFATLFGFFALLIVFLAIIALGIYPFFEKKLKDVTTGELLGSLISAFCILFVFPFALGLLFATNEKGTRVKINFKDNSTISSKDSSQIVMIGKTKDYLFLLSKKDSICKAVKMDEVTSIEYLNKVK